MFQIDRDKNVQLKENFVSLPLNISGYLNCDRSVGFPLGERISFFFVHVQNKLRNKMSKVLYYLTVSVVQESESTLSGGFWFRVSREGTCHFAVIHGCHHYFQTLEIHFQTHSHGSRQPILLTIRWPNTSISPCTSLYTGSLSVLRTWQQASFRASDLKERKQESDMICTSF